MGNSWYYMRGGIASRRIDPTELLALQAAGQPVDFAQLRQMVATGQIADTDSVWSDGMAAWSSVSAITDLTSAVANAKAQSTDASSKPISASAIYSNAFMPRGLPSMAPPVYAGFLIRVAAAMIDAFIVFALLLPFMLAIYNIWDVKSDDEPMGQFVSVMIVVGAWIYFAVQESRPAQATFGKRALGLMVCDLEGRRISFGRATGRHFAKFLSELTLSIGFLMAGFTPKKQGLHDMIAGCIVVKKPPVPHH